MRILLVASKTEDARDLHQKLLSYRGVYWDLKHVKDYEEAMLSLLKETYDVVLLKLQGNELVEGSITSLLEHTATTPFVAIIDPSFSDTELNWMAHGIDDVLRADTLTTNYLMRRLRISLARSERKQAEHRHAIEKLVYHRSTLQCISQKSADKLELSSVNDLSSSHQAKPIKSATSNEPSNLVPETWSNTSKNKETEPGLHESITDDSISAKKSDANKAKSKLNLAGDGSLEAAWIAKERCFESPLSVALLKERGTSRLFEETKDTSTKFIIDVFRDLDAYKECLENYPTKYDICVVEQDFFEREGAQEFDHNSFGFPAPPMILVSTDRSDVSAVTHILHGFDDCIPIQSASTNSLLRSALFSLERWEYAKRFVNEKVAHSPNISERRINPRTGLDRRTATRYLVTRPLMAIPVLADGSPDTANIREAFSLDFSVDGIGFQVSSYGEIPARNWVVGMECEPQDNKGVRFFYANVTVRSVSYPQGGVRLGTQFNRGALNMLSPEFLLPKLNPQSGQFQHPISPAALEKWIELGVLRPKLLHRIRVCPECSGTATLGSGCSECGSPDIRFTELIHHFACAHFGRANDFKQDDVIRCPKCLLQPLVIGVDFEVVRSHYDCLDCGTQGSDIADVGTCLHCRLRFAEHLAEEKEVYGYDVDRLDILAVINSAN